MRKLKIIEHISLDGVIQAGSDKEGGFPYGDWSAPYRSPAGSALVLAEYGESFDLLLGQGKRLFADGTPARALSLTSSRALPSGILVNSYKAAGALQNLG